MLVHPKLETWKTKPDPKNFRNKKQFGHFSICACHSWAKAMLILFEYGSEGFVFEYELWLN